MEDEQQLEDREQARDENTASVDKAVPVRIRKEGGRGLFKGEGFIQEGEGFIQGGGDEAGMKNCNIILIIYRTVFLTATTH